MPRTRILHVVLNLHHGGLERVIGDLVRYGDRDRFEQHVLAVRFLGDLSAGLERYAELHVAPPMSKWSLLRPTALAERIRALRPGVVHSHSGVWYKSSLAARMAGVPRVVHTDHGRQSPDPWSDRLLDGLASTRTDVVVAVSEALGAQMERTVVRGRRSVHVIPNGIDTDRFRRKGDDRGLRARLGIDPEAPVLGSIGRLDPIKCYDVMIRAHAILRARWSGPVAPALVIAGDGPDRPRLDQVIAEVGGDGIHMMGWIEDVHAVHEISTLFTMSSRSEGTSIGLLEAMSAQLCPVVTDVGGNAAVLGEGLRHRLCESGSPEALATAWQQALSDPERLQRDGTAARQRVEREFSARKMVEEYAKVYLPLA